MSSQLDWSDLLFSLRVCGDDSPLKLTGALRTLCRSLSNGFFGRSPWRKFGWKMIRPTNFFFWSKLGIPRNLNRVLPSGELTLWLKITWSHLMYLWRMVLFFIGMFVYQSVNGTFLSRGDLSNWSRSKMSQMTIILQWTTKLIGDLSFSYNPFVLCVCMFGSLICI